MRHNAMLIATALATMLLTARASEDVYLKFECQTDGSIIVREYSDMECAGTPEIEDSTTDGTCYLGMTFLCPILGAQKQTISVDLYADETCTGSPTARKEAMPSICFAPGRFCAAVNPKLTEV